MIAATEIQTEILDQLLTGWLQSQRWFAGKGRPISGVTSVVSTLSDDHPAVWIDVATVNYDDGPSETYFVPLTVHAEPDDRLAHALIGELRGAGGETVWVHDALLDRPSTPIWLRLLADGTDLGWLRFSREPGAAVPTDVLGDILTFEQSNSSLIYGDAAITKFFRRLEPGINPDVEVHDALARRHNPHIAPLLGYATLREPVVAENNAGDDGWPASSRRGAAGLDDAGATVAMTQTFLPVASDGWSLATSSVRDLFAEGDLHPDEVGGDFASESHRLGAAAASVHADLAQVLPSRPADAEWLAVTAQLLGARLDRALRVVPALAPHADGLRACYAAIGDDANGLVLQRIHGDLHLGQALRSASGWTLLDFEGEPARPIPERRRLDSALRDVASMLRSFDYAPQSLLLDGQGDAQLAYRAAEWSNRNRDAFCAGYAEQAGSDPTDQAALLRALEADKAVYEAVYEARHRPSWLTIPLHSLDRLTRLPTASEPATDNDPGVRIP